MDDAPSAAPLYGFAVSSLGLAAAMVSLLLLVAFLYGEGEDRALTDPTVGGCPA
jgi:hypothetical protein